MNPIVVVHWHELECGERVERVQGYGHAAIGHWDQRAGGELTRMLTAAPPAAVVVDLGRLPSHGRAVAAFVRERKATRGVPILFVPGDAAKTKQVREMFPDAGFATWRRMRAALKKAIANPPRDPVVPKAPDYSGTPLPKKLGLKAGGRLCLVRAPKDLAATLGDLPAGVKTTTRLGGQCQVIVLFCRALAQLRADWPRAVDCLAGKGGLWVAWPKKSSGMMTDLDSNIVRAFGLDQGLVDNKVCAIDEVWSGLRFARRRSG